MTPVANRRLPDILERRESDIFAHWIREQLATATQRRNLLPDAEVHDQSRQFLSLLREAAGRAPVTDSNAPAWC